MPSQSVKLAFVGDIMPGRHIDERLDTMPADEFWGDTLPVLRAADAVIGNLECPITSYAHEWRRSRKAFRFRARPPALEVLKAANLRMVNLANNHMLDYQEQGLIDTITHLDGAAIAHAGAGADARAASRPALASVAGATVGLIGLTDNIAEWAAGRSHPGTHFMRIRNDARTLGRVGRLIGEARRKGADIVVVSSHWGPNMRFWPPAYFRRFARHVIELGADVFHGHSAHLFQGVELHRGGLILYDTGDILDDFWVFPGFRTDRSFIFTAHFRDRRFARLVMQPVRQQRTTVGLASGVDFTAACRQMIRRCRPFGTVVTPCSEGLEITASPSVARPLAATWRPMPGIPMPVQAPEWCAVTMGGGS